MIIGVDFLEEMPFDTNLFQSNYNSFEIYKGLIDAIYVDEQTDIPFIEEKSDGWTHSTALNANFKETLEGGSVEAGGMVIDTIRLQRRTEGDLEWHDVVDIDYNFGERTFYEFIDRYVSNEETYQYSLIPISAKIKGKQVSSVSIQAKFEGVFLSDKENNYQLLYNVQHGQIENHIANNIFEPQNSQYPIIVTGNLDYSQFSISALFVSTDTVKRNDGTVDIQSELKQRKKLLEFIKNGKPKVYRDINGNLKMVAVVGNPGENPNETIDGLSEIEINLVEVGNMSTEILKANDLLGSPIGVY